MNGGKAATVRAVALAGPCGAGKTSLMEAMLFAAGAIPRKGSVAAGTTVGDASEEARARGASVELNVAGFDYLGDRYVILDCPGSVEFAAEADAVIPAADMTIVVAEPDPAKAILLQPILHQLQAQGVPHALFINKIDKAAGRLRDILSAIQLHCERPLVARQIPIWNSGGAVGYIDLALERAFLYRPGGASERIDIPTTESEREHEMRARMLEQLADHDDKLLEELINEQEPDPGHVFADLSEELARGLIVPVFLGSAENGSGVRRLLKALRHETPSLENAAKRVGAIGASALVMKTRYAGQAGRQTLVRIMGGQISDGAAVAAPDGAVERIAGVATLQGETSSRRDVGVAGDVVCLGRLERARRGDLLTPEGGAPKAVAIAKRASVYAFAVSAKDRGDDVKLAAAMAKLVDEDPSLEFAPHSMTKEFRLAGQGEMHLKTALDRLARKYGVKVETRRPTTAYRETIRGHAQQRGRLKKQTGGHGQFGDVVMEIKAGERGSGVAFEQKIHGGVVPRQYFSAVEAGVLDALEAGPLGFPVVDVAATLLDGSYHPVDSSEIAFRTAARMAIQEALPRCSPVLLEPVHAVTIHTPSDWLARITALVPMRRGQILSFAPRSDWRNWDTVEAYIPEDELHDLILEIRSATQGLGELASAFDHMAEVTGPAASKAVDSRASAMAK